MIFAFALTAAVTFAFYFILKALGTASMHDFGCDKFYIGLFYIQKKSAAQFVLRKQRYSAYNIRSFACAKDPSQIAVIVCFCVFLVNDVYGYIYVG